MKVVKITANLRKIRGDLQDSGWFHLTAHYTNFRAFADVVKEFVEDPCLRKCDAEFDAAISRLVDSRLDGKWKFQILVLPYSNPDFIEYDNYLVYGKPVRSS